jgi:hypothetical protein
LFVYLFVCFVSVFSSFQLKPLPGHWLTGAGREFYMRMMAHKIKGIAKKPGSEGLGPGYKKKSTCLN